MTTHTTLGVSGPQIFPLALGGNTFGWTSDRKTTFSVLDAFVDGGGNFIDTADGYSAWAPGNVGGESETLIGEWLSTRGDRDRVIVGSKVSQHPNYRGLAPDNVRAAADASLRRLQTDRIDLYYAHFDDPTVPLADTAGAFDALVKTGKVRQIGLSNYTGERVAQWLRIAADEGLAAPTVIQPHYNLVKRQPFESDIAPVVRAHQLAVVPYFSLASGFLTGKYRTEADFSGAAREGMARPYFSPAGLDVVNTLVDIARDHSVEPATIALAWLLAQPSVVAPIASARTVDQLPALLRAGSITLTPAQRAALDEASARVKN